MRTAFLFEKENLFTRSARDETIVRLRASFYILSASDGFSWRLGYSWLASIQPNRSYEAVEGTETCPVS